MRWVLFLLPVAFSLVYKHPLKDFRDFCKRRDNDGHCDLMCRNFLSNTSEVSDCSGYPMTTVNKTFQFLINDISFQGILRSRSDGYYVKEWKNELEMRLRKAMDVEVEMVISDDDLYYQGLECYESRGVCDMQFLFRLTIRSCLGCPTLEEIIARIGQNQGSMAEIHVRYVEQSGSPSSTLVLLLLGVAFVALVGGAMTVLTTKNRKRKVHSHPIWTPPPASQHVLVDQKGYAYRQPFQQFNPNQYPYYQLLNSTNTSPNGSTGSFQQFNQTRKRPAPVSDNQDPLVVNKAAEVCQVNDLHRLVSKKLPEEQLIAEADRLLMMSGIHIDAVNDKEETAVCLAVQENKVQLVAHLLDRGADGNIPDSNGFSLLHHAVVLGHIKCLQLLLKNPTLTIQEDSETGIHKIDELSNSGKTALMECALFKPEDIGYKMAEMIIQTGANVEIQGDRGYRLNGAEHPGKTVLHYAAEMGHNRIVELVLKEAERQGYQILDMEEFNENKTSLWFAAKYGNVETVRLLMEAGANQYLPSSSRPDFPVTVAEEHEHMEVVAVLEEYKRKAKNLSVSKQNSYAVRKNNERKRQERILMTPSSTGSSPSSVSRSPSSTMESPPAETTEPSYYSYRIQSYSLWSEGTIVYKKTQSDCKQSGNVHSPFPLNNSYCHTLYVYEISGSPNHVQKLYEKKKTSQENKESQIELKVVPTGYKTNPNFSPEEVPIENDKCNDRELQKILVEGMRVDDSVMSKRTIGAILSASKRNHVSILCSEQEVAFRLVARKHCQLAAGKVTCILFVL